MRRSLGLVAVLALLSGCHAERISRQPTGTGAETIATATTTPTFECRGTGCNYGGPRGYRGEVYCDGCENIGISTWVSDQLPTASLMPVGILNVSAGDLTLRSITLHKAVGLDVRSIEVAGPQPQAITAVAVMGYPPNSEPLGLRVPTMFEQHPIVAVRGFQVPPARSPSDVDAPITLPTGLMTDPPNKATVVLRLGLREGVSMGWYVGVDLHYTGPTGAHVAHFGEVFGGVCRAEATPPRDDETCDAIATADAWRKSHAQ